MRFIYNLLIRIVAPIAFGLHLARGLRDPAYRDRPAERFGFGARIDRDSIWVHAVSVGEVQASQPLVRALLRRYPGMPLVLTTVTPTGAARARALFGDAVIHRYVPYDLPGSVRRFFDRVRPKLAVILETELWPNLFAECGRRDVPLVLASARVSQRSVRRYRRLVPLFRATLAHGIVIGAQSAADAERFLSIGASAGRTRVTGNVKFDFELAQDVPGRGRAWRERNAPSRPVWVAGSTHESEEELVLDAHAVVRGRFPDALLVLAPRHPPRFEAVRALLEKRGVSYVLRSRDEEASAATEVVLGDTMGELMTFYAAADVAFVAGSLVPIGGHNLLEPAVLGLPMLSGPHTQNAQDVAELLQRSGALRIVRSREDLAQRVNDWFDHPQTARGDGAGGLHAVAQSRGAVERLVAMIVPLLSPPGG
ncbi:MAG: lipid IV(A) 3-deoxy-D-manno-octulosonic acid transferase [Steroidobacteraceae bacterium]|nr:lipid IV(A) 3-deoxy-D-manno-octulosonic acid transferase [Steroidobacteraceae bacterium]